MTATMELGDSDDTMIQLCDSSHDVPTVTEAQSRGINLAILVYALDSEESLTETVSHFLAAAEKSTPLQAAASNGSLAVFLVGTKSDLTPRTVQLDYIDEAMHHLEGWLIGLKSEAASKDGSDPFQHLGVKSFEVSGLTNDGVDRLIESIRLLALSKDKDHEVRTGAEQHLDIDIEEKQTQQTTCSIM